MNIILFNKCKRKIVAADTMIALTNIIKGEIIMATVTLGNSCMIV